MAVGSAAPGNMRSNARATDPFWDKVIQAAENVVVYPTQRISVTVKDRQALVAYDPEHDAITVTMRLSNTTTESEAESDA